MKSYLNEKMRFEHLSLILSEKNVFILTKVILNEHIMCLARRKVTLTKK